MPSILMPIGSGNDGRQPREQSSRAYSALRASSQLQFNTSPSLLRRHRLQCTNPLGNSVLATVTFRIFSPMKAAPWIPTR